MQPPVSPLDETMLVLRATTLGFRRVAESLRQNMIRLLTAKGGREIDISRTADEVALKKTGPVSSLIGALWMSRWRSMFGLGGMGAVELAAGDGPTARHIAVAFADLSGFTQLGEAMQPESLAGLVRRLAINRSSDWFGSPVNIASRVTHMVAPGTVYVSESAQLTADSATHLQWSFAGTYELRGFAGQSRLLRVSRVVTP